MSMLAEPRRKKAWVLNPKGSHWSEDDNKFGQKMLEQMGWSKGQGLGKKKNGIREHIRPSVQNDARGLGYEGRSDDWVAHLDNFNDLLSQLQQSNTVRQPAAPAGNQPKSLEQRSKHSKARVHYHKFTRGKDLSRASSQDLACILGGAVSQPVTPVSSQPPSPPTHADSEPEPEPEPKSEVDSSHGYTTITSGQSCQDYFAEKMRKLNMLKLKKRRKERSNIDTDSEPKMDDNSTAGENEEETDARVHVSAPVMRASVDLMEYAEMALEQPLVTKSKKKRKNEVESIPADDQGCRQVESTDPPKKKKRKKGVKSDKSHDDQSSPSENTEELEKNTETHVGEEPGKREDRAVGGAEDEGGPGAKGNQKQHELMRNVEAEGETKSDGIVMKKKKKKRKQEKGV